MRILLRGCGLLYILLAVQLALGQSVPSNQKITSIGTDSSRTAPAAFALDSVVLLNPESATPNSNATLMINGAGMMVDDVSITIFENAYKVEEINGGGTSGRVNVKLPSDYDPAKPYQATINSVFSQLATRPVLLDTTSGESSPPAKANENADKVTVPNEKDMSAQRKEWEKQAKQMEAYIKAGQRYAIDLARLQAIQEQVNHRLHARAFQ